MATRVEKVYVEDAVKKQPDTPTKKQATKRESGYVLWYDRLKRFGVIVADQGNSELFMLQSSLKYFKSYGLRENERVEFVAGLGRDGKYMAFEVTRGPECYTCHNEGHISRNCPDKKTRESMPKPRECYTCSKEGHISRNCPEKEKKGESMSELECFNCHEIGHMARNCPDNNGQKNQRDGNDDGSNNSHDRNCYNCGRPGHLARNCGNNGSRSRSRGCYNCGDEGHYARDCSKPATINTSRQ